MLDDFADVFLVASETIENDLHFENTVIYIYENNDVGARGVVINKPIDEDVFSDACEAGGSKAFLLANKNAIGVEDFLAGGPVCVESIFAIKQGESVEDLSVELVADVHSYDFSQVKEVAFGCVVWPPGGVQAEFAKGFWEVVPKEAGLLEFDYQERRQEAYCFFEAEGCVIAPGIFEV